MCDIWELLKLMATLSTWTRRDSMELTGMLLFLHHYGKGEALCSVSCCKAFWEPKSSRKGQKYTNIQFFFSFTVLTFFTNTIQYCNRWQFVCIKLLIPGLVLRLLFPRTGIFLEGIHIGRALACPLTCKQDGTDTVPLLFWTNYIPSNKQMCVSSKVLTIKFKGYNCNEKYALIEIFLSSTCLFSYCSLRWQKSTWPDFSRSPKWWCCWRWRSKVMWCDDMFKTVLFLNCNFWGWVKSLNLGPKNLTWFNCKPVWQFMLRTKLWWHFARFMQTGS